MSLECGKNVGKKVEMWEFSHNVGYSEIPGLSSLKKVQAGEPPLNNRLEILDRRRKDNDWLAFRMAIRKMLNSEL
jgi:hypothetical protein